MDFNTTIDLIIRELNEAREIIEDLKKYPGVPVLEIELAKAKCKNAGEVIALIKNLHGNFPADQNNESEVSKSVKEVIYEGKDLLIEKASAEVKPEVIPDPEKKALFRTTIKSPESPIIADSFSHLSGSYNEQLGNLKSEDDIAGILNTKRITSLSEAIGVNDRFLYIREIFNGDKEAFSKAIGRLDSVESISDARAIIKSYTGNDIENDAVTQLLDLVIRKLHSDE
jgi:hypothetical protein